MSDDVTQFLSESQGDIYPSMKFQKLNDFVKGTIIETRLDQRESRFHPGEIETSLLVSLEVDKGRGVVGVKADDDRAQEQPVDKQERVTVWIKRGFMAAAVSQAVREAGDKTLVEGGIFTLAFIEEKDTGKGNPAKVYKASYAPPIQTDAVEFLEHDVAPQDPAPTDDDIPF